MSAGLPGTGIGGLFYIASALWAPVDGLLRTASGRRVEVEWRLVRRQVGIAAAILTALWLTGWGLGYVLAHPMGLLRGSGGSGRTAVETVNLVRWTAVLGSTGILAAVLLLVQILRLTVARPAPERSGVQRGSVVAERRTVRRALPLLLVLGLTPAGATAQSRMDATLTFRVARDSDSNSLIAARILGAATVAPGVRLGVGGGRLYATDPSETVAATEAFATAEWRADRLRIEGEAGGATRGVSKPSATSGFDPLLRVRARIRPTSASALEMRLRHEPISATPELLAAPVVLSELRATVDLPLPGPFVVRTLSRLGHFREPDASNSRFGLGAGGVLKQGELSEVGVFYHRARHAHASEAGYFAPESLEAIELAGYTEHYGAWPLMLALEAGFGLERIADWGVVPGGWKPGLRLWTLVGRELERGGELRLEIEAYDSRAAATALSEAAAWRWFSLATSIRIPV